MNPKKKKDLKIKIAKKRLVYRKIAFVNGLRCVKGYLFIRLMLYKYKIAKELFTLEIEQGCPVLIPKELSQKHLPKSFRYYDPHMRIV